MIENKFFDNNTYLRLLLITPVISLLGLTARHNHQGGYADIPPRTYNSESRGYERIQPRVSTLGSIELSGSP